MTKTIQERVDDTVAFLRGTDLVEVPARTALMVIVDRFLLADKTPQGLTEMSKKLSQGKRPFQSKDTKTMGRAVYLLYRVIKWLKVEQVTPYASAKDVPLANVQQLLEYTIYKTLVADAIVHRRGSEWAKYTFEVLQESPERFLQLNRLMIKGTETRDALQGQENVLRFCFGYNIEKDRWDIGKSMSLPGLHPFDAVSIVATHWSKVLGRGTNMNAGSFAGIDAIKLNGADTVVTTQFTGCAFCYKLSGAYVYAAHIAPGGPGTEPILPGGGKALATQLLGGKAPQVTGAAFANAAGVNPLWIYGREKSNRHGLSGGYGGPQLTWFTMIGFNTGGGWKLFAQEITTGDKIANVRQIYP